MLTKNPSRMLLSSSVNRKKPVSEMSQALVKQVCVLSSVSMNNSGNNPNHQHCEDTNEYECYSTRANNSESDISDSLQNSTNNNSSPSIHKSLKNDLTHPQLSSLSETPPSVQNSRQYDSHYCPACSNLMNIQPHLPVILEPCGHTICANCTLNLGKCSQCFTSIERIQHNSILYQIISQQHNNIYSTSSQFMGTTTLPTAINNSHNNPTMANINYSTSLSRSIDDYIKTIQPIISQSNYENFSLSQSALKSMQSNLELLDSKAKTIHNTLLLEECHIKTNMKEIESKTIEKKSMEQEMELLRKKIDKITNEETYLKNQVVETRNRIKKWTGHLERVSHARNQLENKLDQLHLCVA